MLGDGQYIIQFPKIHGRTLPFRVFSPVYPPPGKDELAAGLDKAQAKKGTIAYGILQAHNTSGNAENLKIKYDAITSHDLTYVGIIQTARASGLDRFPLPYVLTCCHNSLCAVGGTINEDDHVFGLTACKKYGGIYLPPHMGVIHQYMREAVAGGGKMILGSDSHTRYGALGTMAVGEGGGELVKQILEQTWDTAYPEVVAVYLDGKPNPGVGPQDIAIAIVTAVFKNGYVKNKVMEFVGPGVSSMSTDYRNGIDVMTTETTCLSSIWRTDADTKAFLTEHGRPGDFKQLDPADVAYYDGCVYIDLSTVHSMIALPCTARNYLTAARRIDEDVTGFFFDSGDIYEEASHRNAVFVGRDLDGIPRYAHQRGTAERFRLDVKGSDKAFNFCYRGEGERLFVFEAPIDLLSFRTKARTVSPRSSSLRHTMPPMNPAALVTR